ncbi:hypothetical protein A2574_00475 [Candidatus Shapirobacteria bacterium RIFOXYD1_FULL_38_32]|nr:MAG: hypothetical protein A2195_00225 [Candidatus Shapirobacteria bacterium RIFOXYA1_FULL_39_17]OGL56972.1 MAG: hypothetical protein A2410_01130 [Candidatus Shapirobacteria bacterium RIFOXYC1_FULL_38_24]OGL57626.1 MAG: hypothetical protein A2574_00475 [Candidatus Shapirobacteria bacterium RIFOXYD1_FULL_38_32]HAP37387.1 nitric oxide synthase [Candidatus Shapirobacteria bacterium]HCU55348.1 nitric oxide synthase [Candidatus Shapirobacteria bacterium]
MKSLVVYDSMFGNTEKIANEIGRYLGRETKVLSVGKVNKDDIGKLDLLVVGSPTHGGRPTDVITKFINTIPRNLKVVFFDTRFEKSEQGFGLKILLSVIGFATEKMERQFGILGGKVFTESMGFIVTDKEGPIKKGEMERLKNWVEKIRSKLKVLMVK